MPFIAVCTYCGKGKVKATGQHVGQSVTCPTCRMHFTIAGTDESAKYRAGAVPGLPPEEEAVPMVADGATATLIGESSNRIAPAAPAVPFPPPTASPLADGDRPDTSYAPALVACILAGAGMLVSQLPYGRWIAVVLGLAGGVIAVFSFLSADRERRIPLLAVGFNALLLVLVVLLPGWLGLRTNWREEPTEDPNLVKAVDPGTGLGIPAGEPIEAGKAVWQQNDVRVSLGSLQIGPIEVVGANGRRVPTRERYLQIPVIVENSGVARKVEFPGWKPFGPNPPAGGVAIRLTDSTGRALPPKKPAEGFETTYPAPLAGLFPGKSTVQTLLFEVPERGANSLNLELPGSAFGSPESVRYRIPKGLLPPY